jgi:hypothetical protein
MNAEARDQCVKITPSRASCLMEGGAQHFETVQPFVHQIQTEHQGRSSYQQA